MRTGARARSTRTYQLLMGLAGYVTGLIVVVPLLLVATGRWPGPDQRRAEIVPAPLLVSVPRPADRPRIEPDPAREARQIAAERVETARALFARDEIGRVREILAEPVLAADPEAVFLLAEAYDPNVLAARNLAGIVAEAERARQLYARALAGGITRARQRLEALR